MRDRRWCQGNLQHMGVLPARGLHPVSRLHLLTGIGAYTTAWFYKSFGLSALVTWPVALAICGGRKRPKVIGQAQTSLGWR